MTLPVPAAPDQMTPVWLSQALGRAVGSVRAEQIGQEQGFTGGGLYRLRLDDGGSLIAKLSPADPAMRAAFARANRREATFYTGLARGLPVPECAFAAFDPDTGASLLLLEDLGGCRPGQFLDGLTAQECGAVADALAKVHAAWWNASRLGDLSGADMLDEFRFADCWPAYPDALSRLLPDMALPDGFLDFGDFVAANGPALLGALMEQGPCTVLHRDCQADNVMFSADGAALLLDWQLFGKGRGVYDVAYLLISSLDPALRRRIERQVVCAYHARLLAAGIEGYSWDQCWTEYRQSVVGKLVITVMATVLLDNDTDHKRAWRRTDLARLLAFHADHVPDRAVFAA